MHKLSIRDWVELIIAICAIIGLFGGIPKITETVSGILHKPELSILILNTTHDDACRIIIWNYGNKNAEDVKLTIMLFNEYGNLLATNKTIIPLIPKPENGKFLPINMVIKLNAKIDSIPINLDGVYYVEAFVKAKGGYAAEDYKKIYIY